MHTNLVETVGLEPTVPEAEDLQSPGVTNFPTSPKTYKNTLTFLMSLLAMGQPNVFIYALQPPAVNYILNSATPTGVASGWPISLSREIS